jgi:phospholipid N-methyltransferase
VDKLGFLRQFARAPIRTGAVCASSSRLADVMIQHADLDRARTVLELGPGTGIVTERILPRLRADARFLAVEINPDFAAATRRRCPRVEVLQEDAAEARRLLAERGMDGCDAVISGLPWASFHPAQQDRLLSAIGDVLRPGGRFTTFAYVQGLLLPPARRFEKRLRQEFDVVHRTRVVWRNLPPAFAWVGIRNGADA